MRWNLWAASKFGEPLVVPSGGKKSIYVMCGRRIRQTPVVNTVVGDSHDEYFWYSDVVRVTRAP